MSSSTAIPISPDLESTFRSGINRFIIVRIVNEVLVQAYAHPKGGSLESDWSQIANKVGSETCYVLVQVEPSKWVTLTYVPETTKIKDKMVYAATKATLLNHLGYQHFGDDIHANNAEELSWSFYQGTLKPTYSLSHSEEIRDVVHREENEERRFRATQQASRGIGGYHSVAMPFDASATDKVRAIVSGANNFVELAINASKDGIVGVSAKNVNGSFSSEVNTQEPRYYLIKYQGKNVFVYSCPGKAPQQLRMVYSTAKGSVLNEAKQLGFPTSRAGEISEPSELNDALLRELSSSLHGSPAGPTRASNRLLSDDPGENKARRTSSIQTAHPVYSLMGNSSPRTKKVVIPPPGAY